MDTLANWFQETFLPYGAWGVMTLSAMDSSFVPMPGFIDLAIMGAAALSPQNAVSFAIAAVFGSTAGVMVVYSLARSGRYATGSDRVGARIRWAEDFLEKRGTLALLASALMPAPFPFKVVIVAAGYLRQPALSVVVGVAIGRAIRFGALSFLAVRYGDEIVTTVEENGAVAGLVAALLIVAIGVAYYRWQASLED